VTRILVVEDERNLALGLRANLEVEGYEVAVAETGEAALAEAASNNPDLVLLDLMLPGMDGYQVLATLRSRGIDAPVLILSARAEEIDKVRGFRAGADDYVTKPFGVMELVLRVQALLRRTTPASAQRTSWKFGDVEVDSARRLVRRNGQ
jgi:DNA-binding response OmpR family regulator